MFSSAIFPLKVLNVSNRGDNNQPFSDFAEGLIIFYKLFSQKKKDFLG
jgi:hypothetical protein